MLRRAAAYRQVATGQRSSDDECARLDAIRNDAVPRAVQLFHATNTDGVRARALDLSAHFVQQGSQVDNLGLAGAVLKYSLAFGQGSSHQQVFGARDRDLLEYHARPPQPFGTRFD